MRSRWLIPLALLVLAVVTLVAWPGSSGLSPRPAAPGPAPSTVSAAPPSVPAPPPALARATAQPPPVAQGPSPFSRPPARTIDEGYPVNLERLRAETPNNRYWTDWAPTDDLVVSAGRDAEAAEWNQLRGKVLSGTASEPEIRAWIDHRRQVSEDAIDFAQRVLSEYGSELPDRDRGLLELAISMHRTRLEELPRKEAEARARKVEQDRRRAEWNGSPPP